MSSTTCRRYDPGDYDRGIDFFRRLYRSSDAVPFWLPQRWEYAEYLVSPLNRNRGYSHDWEETIYLWESSSGEVVGVLCSENPDSDIFVHTMPDYRHLEKEMIEVAEERIVRRTLGLSDIRVWCASGDSFRESLLRSRRYEKTGDIEYLNWRDLAGSVPDLSLPEGHSLHDMVSEYGLDLQHKIDRMTAAFDSPTYPAEIYRNMQRGFSYRKSLDLYSTDSRGNITSFCVAWVDAELNIGYFEPVGTHIDERRRGLGHAMLNAGLHRLKDAGVGKAYLGSWGEDRRAFYNASGFPNSLAFHPWHRKLG